MPRSRKKHIEIFDLLFRHQVYLEGAKTGLTKQYAAILASLYTHFVKLIDQSRYTRMDQFTRGQLETFVKKFQREQIRQYNIYSKELSTSLKALLAADLKIHKAIMEQVGGERDSKSIFPNADTETKLWDAVLKEPNPANGFLVKDQINDFISKAIGSGGLLVKQAWANSWTTEQAKQAINGNRNDETLPTGLFPRLLSQNAAVVGTIAQNISVQVQAAENSAYFTRYQWVAILDNRTTLICRSRNGTIYIYGEGPLPPAHYNCRSKAVPIDDGVETHQIPQTYYDWLVEQPPSFQNDILGVETADRLRAGLIGSRNFTAIHTIKPLTISEFAAKIRFILQ